MPKFAAGKPEIHGNIVFVSFFEFGVLSYELLEHVVRGSTEVITGKFRQVVHPMPYSQSEPEGGYALITTKDGSTIVVLSSTQPVLSPQDKKGE